MSKILIAAVALASVAVVAQAAYVNDVRHGSCVLGMAAAAPFDRQDYWVLAFSRPQPDQLSNPKKALYGGWNSADWSKAMQNLPLVNQYIGSAIQSIQSHAQYVKQKITNQDPKIPLTRLCVPSALGIQAGLLPSDFVFHWNPTGAKTDRTATLFYRGFIRNGQVLFGIGKARH